MIKGTLLNFSKAKRALGRLGKVVVISVVIALLAISSLAGYYAIFNQGQKTISSTSFPSSSSSTSSTQQTSVTQTLISSSSSSLTTTSSSLIFPHSKNSSELIDLSPSYAPDSFDPGFGFFIDGYFANVFQGLVQYSTNDSTRVVPDLASNWTISANLEKYTFAMRSSIWFSNKDPINAYVAWFSFVRVLYMNAPSTVGISNYGGLTVNTSTDIVDGDLMPHGLRAALVNAGHVPDNEKALVSALNQMMSNFDPKNATQLAIMSYPDQAYLAISNSTFQVNLIQPYGSFLLVLPPQWGAIVDPIFIDAHGGVQNNTSPDFFRNYGMIGSGPYVYQANLISGNSLVLNENQNYWGVGIPNLSPNLAPAKIPTIIMEFGSQPNAEIANFASNNVQIIAPPISQFMQTLLEYVPNYSQVNFGQIFHELFHDFGYSLCNYAIAMNTQVFPTNITLLRQAIVHAVNYSEIQQSSYSFNGTAYRELFLPPVPPGWGPLDNPQNLSLYDYNITEAVQLANQAGQQAHFSLTLPNKTVIGDKTAAALPPIQYFYMVSTTPDIQSLSSILRQGLTNIGVQIELMVCSDTAGCGTGTPSTSPMMLNTQWCADYPDPIYQQFYDLATTAASQANWVNNATLNKLLGEIPFETNTTLQLQQTVQAYQIFTQLSTLIQLPNPANYAFIQPYVQDVVWNPFEYSIWYNMISYS